MTLFPPFLLDRPFGAESRAWMLDRYFADHAAITRETAWQHIYHLLLWIDRTTGLAHCYESDKSQPGRHWYVRSLAFHKWLSDGFGCTPRLLYREVDYLFREGTKILALAAVDQSEKRQLRAAEQVAPYVAFEMPKPGEDPELEAEIADLFEEHYGIRPLERIVSLAVTRVLAQSRLENKRKNLVGEGFEDSLAALIGRILGAQEWDITCRVHLHKVPGFREPPRHEKPRTVDLVLVHRPTKWRVLATVKWSIRADREEQFGVDYEAYVRNESSGEGFDFVLITNEFDAARLFSACNRRHQASQLFSSVIHINPEGLQTVHGKDAAASAKAVLQHIQTNRLTSLASWLSALAKVGEAKRL